MLLLWPRNNVERRRSNQFFFSNSFQALREAGDAREESLLWLKSRLSSLTDVSSEVETQRQQSALNKLSADFKELLSSLYQVCARFFSDALDCTWV